MKVRLIATGLVLLFLTSNSFALLGPPTAELGKGQWSLSGNYFYSSQDIGRIKVDYTEVGTETPGGPYRETDSYRLDIKDFNLNRYYAQLGYGLLENWEVFAQLGAVDIEGKYREVGDRLWNKDKFDTNLLYGLGTKYTFVKKDKIAFGAALQVNYFNADSASDYNEVDPGYTETGRETIDLDVWDITLAVGPTFDMGGWKLYGGALYNLLLGEHNFKTRGSWVGGTTGTFTCRDNGDTNVNNYGGYLGAQFNIQKKFNVKVEGLGTNNGWGVGTGIEFLF
jgi:hypothetical protein